MLTIKELADISGQKKKKILELIPTSKRHKLASGKWGIPPSQVNAFLSLLGVDYSFATVACLNLKGGTGKTTTVVTSASRAREYGFKICIIDMDAQANATQAFGITPEEDDPVFCDVWENPDEMVMGALHRIDEYLYILPSGLENSLLDVSLMNPASQKKAVKRVCGVLQENGFNLVMIDCPPSLGTAVISSICAASLTVIPICSDMFSVKGLEFTIGEIESICETFGLKKPLIRILHTHYDKRLAISAHYIKQIAENYPDTVVPFPIRTSSLFSKMLEKKETVFAAGWNLAAKDYDRFVRYLLKL